MPAIPDVTSAQLALAFELINSTPPPAGAPNARWIMATLNTVRTRARVPVSVAQAMLTRALQLVPFLQTYEAPLTAIGAYAVDRAAGTAAVHPLVYAVVGAAPLELGGLLNYAEVLDLLRKTIESVAK